MTLLAHHVGEESLASLLLFGGGTLSFVVAVGRAHLADVRARLRRGPGADQDTPEPARR